MGFLKKIRRKVEKAAKKTYKKVDNFVEKKVERPVKKLVKKIATEVEDTVTGKNKYTRDPSRMPTSQTAQARTGAPREEAEEVATTVETGSGIRRRRRQGKKALVAARAAANVGGEGTSGLNIPKA